MSSIREERAELLTKANTLIDERKSADRALSDRDREILEEIKGRIHAIDKHLAKARKDAELMRQLGEGAGQVVDLPWKSAGGTGAGQYSKAGHLTRDAVSDLAHRLATKAGAKADGDTVMVPEDATDRITVGIYPDPQVPSTLFEIIPTARTTSGPTLRVMVQTQRDLAAAVVPPGELKPTSKLAIGHLDITLQTVATISDPVDVMMLSDVAELTGFIQSELQYGVLSELERLAINGTAADLFPGFLATNGVQTVSYIGDAITSIRHAITALESAGFKPSGIALKPADWEAIELATTAGSGEYVLAQSPVDRSAQRLWGVPVVVTNALPAGKALVLSTDCAQLFTDGGIRLKWSDSAEEDFTRNQLRLRAESRWALAVQRPNGVAVVDTVAA